MRADEPAKDRREVAQLLPHHAEAEDGVHSGIRVRRGPEHGYDNIASLVLRGLDERRTILTAG